MSEETPQPDKPGPIARVIEKITAEPARAAMVLGVALVVAVLGALGIQGDLLTRMVRNLPIVVSAAFILILLGLTLPYMVRERGAVAQHRLGILAVILVVVGAGATVGVAAYSMSEREQPTLAIAPTWSTEVPGEATLAITASASSLRTSENVLLRVIGMKAGSGVNAMQPCQDPDWAKFSTASPFTVLVWSNSGPTVNGVANVATSLPVSATQYDYICAFAVLRERSTVDKNDDRWAVSILDLHRETTGSNATLPPVSP